MLKSLSSLSCAFTLGLFGAASSCSGEDRPNIILIISDDHTYTHYGFMGHEIVETPNLDRMAGESLLFTRGYTPPVCAPSLGSLLTGMHPSRHGITGNDIAGAGRGQPREPMRERLWENAFVLPQLLSEEGYLTMQTGKIWNGSYAQMGFTHGMTEEGSRHGGKGLRIARETMDPIFEFIEHAAEEGKPFFVWHAPFLPHDPHNPPDEFLEKYLDRGPTEHGEVYHAMVDWFDHTCGELDAWLEANGYRENTVILYLSDNGWDSEAGYHGGRAKLTPYEDGIRTPMFVRWVGEVEPLRDDETLASILDFVPTILDLAGIEHPVPLPGINLMDREAMQARESVFVECYSHDIIDLSNPAKSLTARTVINGWSKLIVPGPHVEDLERRPFAALSGEVELFDLKNDPRETTNLAEVFPEEVRRLRALLDAHWNPVIP